MNNRRVDIALLLPSLHGGGAERITVTLANGFAKKGLNVDLVLASADGAYLTEVSPTVRIVDLKSRRMLTSLPGLISYLKTNKPVVMLSAMNYVNVIAVIARSLSRTSFRLVIAEHSNLSSAVASPQSRRVRFLVPFMRFFYPKADGIVAVSKGVADDLSETISLPKDRISVIYNPVVSDEMIRQSMMPVDHQWLNDEMIPVVLAVGRLTPAKDFPTLLKAFSQVKDLIDCKLVILGDGPLRKTLEKTVADLGLINDIQLHGFAANPYSWMRKSSVFVLSSAWEGLPTVVIEAMACGAQIVSTDCKSGPREILEDGKWGALTSVGDVDGLASAIAECLSKKKSIDGKKRALDFSVENSIDRYMTVLFEEAKSESALNV